LNTWLSDVPHCKDNTDHECWCQEEQFITDVYSCFTSWEPEMLIVQAAVYYLAGLCAPHVPQNPAIVTACPPGVVIAPPPTSTMSIPASAIITTHTIVQTVTSCSAGETVAVGGVTTVVASPTTLTVDVTQTTTVCPICTQTPPAQNLQTITVGSTTCTVPNVAFVTATISGSPSVNLIQPTGSWTYGPTSGPTSAVAAPASVSGSATATYKPVQVTGNAAVKNGGAAGAAGVFAVGLAALLM
jgi:hypothetical protein